MSGPATAGSRSVRVVDLGRAGYRAAFERQRGEVERVLGERESGVTAAPVGTIFLVEHEPVITVSRRASASGHVLADQAALARAGVAIEPTDRGGDVTYHGPGQLVCYPVLDLNRLGLNLHGYMRLLEGAVIETIARWGLAGRRDQTATGVWVGDGAGRKIAAMGVRVRRWVAMHGLALNVDPDMAHFGLIVPCGLVGREVTSMAAELSDEGSGVPSLGEVGIELARVLARAIDAEPVREDPGPGL